MPEAFPQHLLQLNLIPNLQNLLFELNYYFLEYVPGQRDTIATIVEGVKLLAVPGNVLESFELTIDFDHPVNSELRMQRRLDLFMQWFKQFAALDNILSSPHFKLLHPPCGQADIVFDFDQILGRMLPIPTKPQEALQILSELKVLQVFR